MANDLLNRLKLFEPKDIVPMEVRTTNGAEDVQIEGNSILSLIYIHAIDPGTTLQINYYDSGAGTRLGEENLVGSHPLITATGSSRLLITRMTNKSKVKWTIAGGGSVYFGVYAFVVSSFASDLDQALKSQGQIVDLLNDKGLVAMGYDADQNKFFFLPIKDGVLQTSTEIQGEPRLATTVDNLVTIQNTPMLLIDVDLDDLDEIWRVRQVEVACRSYAKFVILVDGERVASGRTGPDCSNVVVPFEVYLRAESSIMVQFLQSYGPIVDVEAYVRATLE